MPPVIRWPPAPCHRCAEAGVRVLPALTGDQIEALVAAFARAAVMLEDAGFDGVELHAAHAYLIGQFLAPDTTSGPTTGAVTCSDAQGSSSRSSEPCAAVSSPASPSPSP